MSPSINPTRAPLFASATARFVETVDLPTPPFPLETAITLPSSGYVTGCCGGGTGRRAGASFITGNARPPGPLSLMIYHKLRIPRSARNDNVTRDVVLLRARDRGLRRVSRRSGHRRRERAHRHRIHARMH